jgi:NAD(P)-dependent dehydrogenase (short-subunit alcohol dehydrogenase family)
VAEAIAALGGLDCLVTNAGGQPTDEERLSSCKLFLLDLLKGPWADSP